MERRVGGRKTGRKGKKEGEIRKEKKEEARGFRNWIALLQADGVIRQAFQVLSEHFLGATHFPPQDILSDTPCRLKTSFSAWEP